MNESLVASMLNVPVSLLRTPGLHATPSTGAGGSGRASPPCSAWARDEGYELARYRALTTNLASLRVAEKLGFTPFGANVAVRLAGGR